MTPLHPANLCCIPDRVESKPTFSILPRFFSAFRFSWQYSFSARVVKSQERLYRCEATKASAVTLKAATAYPSCFLPIRSPSIMMQAPDWRNQAFTLTENGPLPLRQGQ